MAQVDGIDDQMDNQSGQQEGSSPHADLTDLIGKDGQFFLKGSRIIVLLESGLEYVFVGVDANSQDHHIPSPLDHFGARNEETIVIDIGFKTLLFDKFRFSSDRAFIGMQSF